MFAFLAALGPIGIGAAIVGTAATAAYAYMKDDENTESTKSNTENTTHHEEKNKLIKSEIESYKKSQKKRLKSKYGINIKFGPDSFQGLFNHLSNTPAIIGSLYSNLDSSSKVINIADEIDKKFESISKLEDEIQELDNLIFELERMKNESV
jgi:hypothetical protein